MKIWALCINYLKIIQLDVQAFVWQYQGSFDVSLSVIAGELCECVLPFCGFGAWSVKLILIIIFLTVSAQLVSFISAELSCCFQI